MASLTEKGHTPGPWRVSSALPTKTRGIDILAGHSRMTASVYLHPHYMADDAAADHANAKLVAAAPDLLAALQAIIDLDDGDAPDLWHFEKEFDAGRAAIAKALGK